MENSPFSEQLLEKGYEIIYFTDPVDEYVMQNLMEYDDFKFQSASKEDLKLGDKDAKKENKRLKVWVRGQDLALLKQASELSVQSSCALEHSDCMLHSLYGYDCTLLEAAAQTRCSMQNAIMCMHVRCFAQWCGCLSSLHNAYSIGLFSRLPLSENSSDLLQYMLHLNEQLQHVCSAVASITISRCCALIAEG